MRQPIIAGNWKMHMTNTEATVFVEQLKPLVADASCEVVVCPPFTAISTVADLAEDTKVRVGAQTCSTKNLVLIQGKYLLRC